jgi:hypothetical protein
MAVQFSKFPGRHERHYRRRLANPLFPGAAPASDQEVLLEMQRLDHEELLGFLAELRQTVQSAVDLQPNVASDEVLELKEQLDRMYEVSAGLAEDHGGNQAAIKQLLEVIMANVERGAAGDPRAMDELAQERVARAAHFELLATPLVADLLHPYSNIAADELAPSLLSEDEPGLAAALQLFDLLQLRQVFADASDCLANCAEPPAGAHARLQQIGSRLALLERQTELD